MSMLATLNVNMLTNSLQKLPNPARNICNRSTIIDPIWNVLVYVVHFYPQSLSVGFDPCEEEH